MRNLIAAGAAVGLLAAPVALAQPAQAATSCTITVQSKIWVDSPTETLYATRISDGCRTANSSWGLFDPNGTRRGTFRFDAGTGQVTSSVKIADGWPSGTYRVRPLGSVDVETGTPLTQNSTSTLKKFGIRGPISYRRASGRITVATTVQRYLSSSDSYGPHRYAEVKLYRRINSRYSWQLVDSTRTNRYGKATLTGGASRAYYYQVYVVGTSSVWGSKSPSATYI